MHPKSKEFKALLSTWDKKLKESGFKDIEYREKDTLIRYHSIQFLEKGVSALDPISLKAKESYYRSAEFFLNSHKFDNPLERKIWALHSEGKSMRYIAKLIKTSKDKTLMSVTMRVQRIVSALAKIMVDMWQK